MKDVTDHILPCPTLRSKTQGASEHYTDRILAIGAGDIASCEVRRTVLPLDRDNVPSRLEETRDVKLVETALGIAGKFDVRHTTNGSDHRTVDADLGEVIGGDIDYSISWVPSQNEGIRKEEGREFCRCSIASDVRCPNPDCRWNR